MQVHTQFSTNSMNTAGRTRIHTLLKGRLLKSSLGNRVSSSKPPSPYSSNTISLFSPHDQQSGYSTLPTMPLHFSYFQNSESFIRAQPCMLSRSAFLNLLLSTILLLCGRGERELYEKNDIWFPFPTWYNIKQQAVLFIFTIKVNLCLKNGVNKW